MYDYFGRWPCTIYTSFVYGYRYIDTGHEILVCENFAS